MYVYVPVYTNLAKARTKRSTPCTRRVVKLQLIRILWCQDDVSSAIVVPGRNRVLRRK